MSLDQFSPCFIRLILVRILYTDWTVLPGPDIPPGETDGLTTQMQLKQPLLPLPPHFFS